MAAPFLSLPANNLYRNGYIYVFSDGTQLLLRDILVFKPSLTDKYHLLKLNETLDYLAWYYYKDIVQDASKFWYVIADANNIINPLDLEDYYGKELLIPNIVKSELSI